MYYQKILCLWNLDLVYEFLEPPNSTPSTSINFERIVKSMWVQEWVLYTCEIGLEFGKLIRSRSGFIHAARTTLIYSCLVIRLRKTGTDIRYRSKKIISTDLLIDNVNQHTKFTTAILVQIVFLPILSHRIPAGIAHANLPICVEAAIHDPWINVIGIPVDGCFNKNSAFAIHPTAAPIITTLTYTVE